MALWMVRSWGGVDTDRDGDTDPIILVGRHREVTPNGDQTVELLETRSADGASFIRRQPHVVACEPARDGTFADDSEGEILIFGNATAWRASASNSAPGSEEDQMLTNNESGMQRVPVKMYRSDGRVMIATPMPGLEPTDLRVEVTSDNRIILRGSLRGIRQDEKDLLLNEWTVGNYERELDLPVAVDGTMANVTYDNGVLVVTLPLARQTRPAVLNVPAVGEAHGQRVGNSGHPPRPPAKAASG